MDQGRGLIKSIGSKRRFLQNKLHSLTREQEQLRKRLRQGPYRPRGDVVRHLDRVNKQMLATRRHLDEATQEGGARYERESVPRGGQLQEVINLIS